MAPAGRAAKLTASSAAAASSAVRIVTVRVRCVMTISTLRYMGKLRWGDMERRGPGGLSGAA